MCEVGYNFWQSLSFIDGDRSHNQYTLLYSFPSFYLFIYFFKSVSKRTSGTNIMMRLAVQPNYLME